MAARSLSRVMALLAAERAALWRIERGDELCDVLCALLLQVEATSTAGVRCSVLLLNDAGTHLAHCAAPSLPAAYNAAIDGIAIGEGVGSCGTAAHRHEAVHVADIAADPLWADFRDLALGHGLRACWSEPLAHAERGVVGTFACYYGEPRAPELEDLEAIALVSRAVGLAVARARELRRLHDWDALRQSQKLESLGQLTAGVAHDFNNLLTPVMGALDLVDRRLPAMDGPLRQAVAAAIESAERAKSLVQRLLAFARKQHLLPQAVDVAALVAGMQDLLRRTLDRRIETAIDTPASLDPVLVDPGQLELAILNLALNACDAMPHGGTLTISARQERVVAGNDMELGAGPYVRVRVADTGCGMDAETARRAIEPFYTTKAIGKGSGLGLSMAHGLARQSGGGLCIESVPGAGTVVELWLPVTVAVRQAIATSAGGAVAAPAGLIVLVVDDEELVRTLTASLLVEMGHSVIEAAGPARAIEHLRSRPDIGLLLTDYLMPGQTGVELAREARRMRPDLPVLLMTGYANPAGEGDGRLPRLAKPFRTAQLAERIAELVGGVARA